MPLSGYTPLHYCAMSGNLDTTRLVCEMMVKYDVTCDIRDRNGVTPYVLARRRKLREIMDALVHYGNCSPSQLDPGLINASLGLSEGEHDGAQRGELVIQLHCLGDVTGLECQLEAAQTHPEAHGVQVDVILLGGLGTAPIVSIR